MALTMTNCTVYDNTAYNGATTGSGGGIRNATGPGISSILSNCTIANNAASFAGGGHGGDILNDSGSNLTLNNCIVAYSQRVRRRYRRRGHRQQQPDRRRVGCRGLSAANGNILSTNLLLAPPANYGGPTKTVEPLPGSPALGAGDPSLIPAGVTTDQRGPRTRGGTVDIGAFERGPSNIVVTTLADENNGGIDPALGAGTSLREAIDFANVDPGGGDTITFAPGLWARSRFPRACCRRRRQRHYRRTRRQAADHRRTGEIQHLFDRFRSDRRHLRADAGQRHCHEWRRDLNAGTLDLTDCTLSGNTARTLPLTAVPSITRAR